jgi:hypothetical protein
VFGRCGTAVGVSALSPSTEHGAKTLQGIRAMFLFLRFLGAALLAAGVVRRSRYGRHWRRRQVPGR